MWGQFLICSFKTESCQSWPCLGLSKNWPHINYWEKSCKHFKSSKQIWRELIFQMFPHQNYEPFKDNCNLHSLRDLYTYLITNRNIIVHILETFYYLVTLDNIYMLYPYKKISNTLLYLYNLVCWWTVEFDKISKYICIIF
jgi:hypothetical protein